MSMGVVVMLCRKAQSEEKMAAYRDFCRAVESQDLKSMLIADLQVNYTLLRGQYHANSLHVQFVPISRYSRCGAVVIVIALL